MDQHKPTPIGEITITKRWSEKSTSITREIEHGKDEVGRPWVRARQRPNNLPQCVTCPWPEWVTP